MTTFTTEDRILAEKDGSLTVNVNAGEVTASPPHIVDSGASVMSNEPVAYRWKSDLGYIYDIYDHGNGEPLYTHPSEHDLGIAEAIGFDKGYKAATAKTLTDEEILEIAQIMFFDPRYPQIALGFARAILEKASKK